MSFVFTIRYIAFLIVFVGIASMMFVDFSSAYDDITVFTDKKTYFLRDTVQIWGDINNLSEKNIVTISVTDPEGLPVMEFETKIDRKERDYNYQFTLLGNLAEGIYTINVSYGEIETNTSFSLFWSEVGKKVFPSTITFDKDTYSWTDTVEIHVYAPSYNRSNQVDYIGLGSESEGKIEIQTGLGRLENYRLIETEYDSGIFHGKITLTGDPTIDVNKNNRKDDASGISSDNYPFDGKIPTRNNDEIKVIFSNDVQKIEQTSQIKWAEGKIGLIEYSDGSLSYRLRVIDKDMDLSSESPDYVTVTALHDQKYSQLDLKEVGFSTGVFEGSFSKKFTSFVYYDRTIPYSTSSGFVKITPSTTFVDKSINPTPNFPTNKKTMESLKLKIQIPSWVKTTAGYWGQGSISESDFIKMLQYLINEQIILIEDLGEPGKWEDHDVSRWNKAYARFWSEGLVSDEEFVKGIQNIVEQGLIQVR